MLFTNAFNFYLCSGLLSNQCRALTMHCKVVRQVMGVALEMPSAFIICSSFAIRVFFFIIFFICANVYNRLSRFVILTNALSVALSSCRQRISNHDKVQLND